MSMIDGATEPGLGHDARAVLSAHRAILRRRLALVLTLGGLTLAGLTIDLVTGPSGLPLAQLWSALIGADDVTRVASVILWQVRLPVALMALLVGAALSLAGAEMQTILDNPLASPFTLGVSAAASLGAALAIVLGLSLPLLPPGLAIAGNAFVFAFGSVLMLQAVARRSRGGPELLVLFGIALVFGFNALLSLMQFVASADALQQLVFWSMGSLARSNWTAIAILAGVVVLVTPFSLAASVRLTALRMGEERATSFGIDVGRLRFLSLLRASLLAATAVAFTGAIGFVGLVGPHIARMLIGEDHRFFLPASALSGALMMSGASVASKLIIPGVLLPVGIVTALVGLPVFVALILQRGARTR
jgi:iron complex transport system permease protein